MPLHFNSFVGKKEDNSKLFAKILPNVVENPDEVFVSKDKKVIHATQYIVEKNSKKRVGKAVVTMLVKEDTTEVIDADITLLNDKPIVLNFLDKLEESSEANEYYDVSTIEDEKHFQVETVNRQCLEKENIENTIQKVFISVFPFRFDVFNSMEELNKEYGFSETIKTVDNLQVHGFAEDFLAVGGVLNSTNDPCSFIIGKVTDYSDETILIGGVALTFTIVFITTGIGIVPVATSREQFDLSNLSIGKIVGMLADVKADFTK